MFFPLTPQPGFADAFPCPLPLWSTLWQLGLSHRIHSGVFREVVGMDGCFIVEVCAGTHHDHRVFCCCCKVVVLELPIGRLALGCIVDLY